MCSCLYVHVMPGTVGSDKLFIAGKGGGGEKMLIIKMEFEELVNKIFIIFLLLGICISKQVIRSAPATCSVSDTYNKIVPHILSVLLLPYKNKVPDGNTGIEIAILSRAHVHSTFPQLYLKIVPRISAIIKYEINWFTRLLVCPS